MKKRNIVIGVLSMFVILISGWIVFRHDFGPESAKAERDSSVDHLAFEDYIVDSKYPNVGIKKEASHDDTHDTYINYPVFLNDKLNEHIYRCVEEQRDAFLTLHDDIEAAPEDEMLLNVSFDIHQVNEDTYSLAINSTVQGRIANSIYSNKYFIVDTGDNQFLDEDDIFANGQQETLKKSVKNKLLKQPDSDIFEEELDTELDNDNVFHYLHFTKDHMVFNSHNTL